MEASKSDKHKGCERAFVHTSAAWYGKTAFLNDRAVDEVMLGMYHPDGGTTGEFGVRWYELGHRVVPKLEVYDDAWDALTNFGDVLEAMSVVDGKDISAEEFCEILVKCGLIDKTDRKGPTMEMGVHDQLVAALKGMLEYADIIEDRCDAVATNAARAALAAAGEKP